MARTTPGGKQIKDHSIQRTDLDVTTPGESIITKVTPGVGITITSTGIDTGTGEVSLAIASYLHDQQDVLSLWAINHNLHRYPSIIAMDLDGNEILGDISYIDTDNLTITFTPATAGKAYLT